MSFLQRAFWISCFIAVSSFTPAKASLASPDRVFWFDLQVSSIEKAANFYTQVFGWTFAPTEFWPKTIYIGANGQNIGTLSEEKRAVPRPRTFLYFAVENLSDTYNRAISMGAKSYAKPCTLPSTGNTSVALIRDRDNNSIGIWAPGSVGKTCARFDNQPWPKF